MYCIWDMPMFKNTSPSAAFNHLEKDFIILICFQTDTRFQQKPTFFSGVFSTFLYILQLF